MTKLIVRIILCLLPILSAVTVQAAEQTEHAVWNRNPIRVILPVGKERRIDFPVPGDLKVPGRLLSLSKPIQLREDGSAYWTATESFPATRVQYITNTGYSYLLDVEARQDAESVPLIIVDTRVKSSVMSQDKTESASQERNYDYVDLSRFASQNIYAPERLVKALPGVSRVNVKAGARPLYKGGQLILEPMASWKSQTVPSLFVTAVRVTSNSLDDQAFDPRKLRGEWLAATTQHTIVQAAGSTGDTTTWYLVSALPFDDAAPIAKEDIAQ